MLLLFIVSYFSVIIIVDEGTFGFTHEMLIEGDDGFY